MSYFIQDNQAVITTKDDKIIFLLKGGDNNVSSAYSNKRCTGWFMQGVFQSYTDYMSYIEDALASDISGGSWQFNSLINKHFNGFREYENTIINRFERAFKKAIQIDWNISDVTVDNVKKFKEDIESALEANKFSLNNEDGNKTGLQYFIVSYDKDVTPEENAVKKLEPKTLKSKDNGRYIEFCKEYSDSKIEELINDVQFCSSFSKFDITWSSPASVLANIKNARVTNSMNFACFNIMLNNNENTVKKLLSLYESDINYLISMYPIQMETLVCLSTFKDKAKKIISEADKYEVKRFDENFNTILNADYKLLKTEIKKEIQNLLDSSKDKFIETWNNLLEDCWFKQTNERLLRSFDTLKSAYSTQTFTLDDIKENCENDFHKILHHYQNQSSKNKKVIKKVFKELLDKYTLLFSKESIDLLCKYFDFESPAAEKQKFEAIKEKEVEKVIVPVQKTQQSLLDFI